MILPQGKRMQMNKCHQRMLVCHRGSRIVPDQVTQERAIDQLHRGVRHSFCFFLQRIRRDRNRLDKQPRYL